MNRLYVGDTVYHPVSCSTARGFGDCWLIQGTVAVMVVQEDCVPHVSALTVLTTGMDWVVHGGHVVGQIQHDTKGWVAAQEQAIVNT